MPVASLTTDQILRVLLPGDGARWTGSTITFSFPQAGGAWPGYASNEPFSASFTPLTAGQQQDVRDLLHTLETVIPVHFVETSDASAPGQIRIAYSGINNAFPYGYAPPAPGATAQPSNGDIWLSQPFAQFSLTPGNAVDANNVWHYATPDLLRAVEQALGFTHHMQSSELSPLGAYSFTTFTAQAIDWGKQASFFTAGYSDTTPVLLESGHAPLLSGPTVFDILALQSLYGANTTTNAGNTVYTADTQDTRITTVYDTGGIDTIDASAVTRPSLIDLTPGAYSSIGLYSAADQIAHWTAALPQYADVITSRILGVDARGRLYTWENNLGIAYGTVIENAAGGSAADTIVGNAAANVITGGAGGDMLSGGSGDDTIVATSGSTYLRGDDGNDTISGGSGFDDINGNKGDDTAHGWAGDDWVVGGKDQDALFGDDGGDIVYGNLGDDSCDGGAGADLLRGGQGNDTLSGGDGDDWLSGDRGNDTLTGGAGADTFHTFGDAGIDRVTDFSVAQGDKVQLDPGTVYSVVQSGADTVISMTGGAQMILVGVQLSSLPTGWIFGA